MMLQFRRLTCSDMEAQAQLLAVCFQHSQPDMLCLWRWMYEKNEWVAWGAWEGTRLVAQYSSVVRQLVLPGENRPRKTGMCVNMAVHPDFRGRGIIKQIAGPVYAQLGEMGAICGVGFSNAAGVKVDRHSQGYGYHVLGKMQAALVLPMKKIPSKDFSLSSSFPEFSSDDRPSADGKIHFCSSSALLRQRYAEHPLRRYRFGWEAGPSVRGMVIDLPIRFGCVAGTALYAAYGRNLPILLQHWAHAVYQAGARFIYYLSSPSSSLPGALHQVGPCWKIHSNHSPYYLTVKPLQPELAPILLDYTRWECDGGDIQ